jgi:hypothetical protein
VSPLTGVPRVVHSETERACGRRKGELRLTGTELLVQRAGDGWCGCTVRGMCLTPLNFDILQPFYIKWQNGRSYIMGISQFKMVIITVII